ncbi:MAG: response regulator transcription factor [Gammaproteobacteria bacterium]|nr:response regulator transcription factor [Gammaproteobacteria bacterium]
MKILIVEDSSRLRRALGEGLRRSGFTIDQAADGREGLAYARSNDYDILILDIMMPSMDGLEMLRALRRDGNKVQVLILSAKDQVDDRVRGLDIGADDYLVKPFAFEELVARLKALARRRHNSKDPRIVVGTITVDMARRRVLGKGDVIPLTPSEYRIVEQLALQRGRVISKERLWELLNDANSETTSNVIEVLVSSIRRKLRVYCKDGLIQTRRGFGYLIETRQE